MNLPPPHVLARLDALIVGQSIAANDDVESGVRSVGVEDDDDRSISSAAFGIESSATSFSEDVVPDDAGGARTTSSRFWGVSWNRGSKKWQAHYKDTDGKSRTIGYFDGAARAQGVRPRAKGLVQAPPRRIRRRYAIDARPPPASRGQLRRLRARRRRRLGLDPGYDRELINNKTHLEDRIAPPHSPSAAASGRRTSKCEAPSTLTMVRGSGTVSTKLSKVEFEQKTSSVAWSSIFGRVEARAAAAWSV